MQSESIEWFIQAIRDLPSDEPVANRQVGYNNYRTQKDHWLGWLDPNSGTGTYPRADAPNRNAKYVYNHIVEPKMLLWLITASEVEPALIKAAQGAAAAAASMPGQSAAIRKCVPWSVVASALSKAQEGGIAQRVPPFAAGRVTLR
jgi:hypothetical protein